MAHGEICSVCSVGEEGGIVGIWKARTWTDSIFGRPEDNNGMPEFDMVMPAEDFAELVRAERRNK